MTAPILEARGLEAFYGAVQVLYGVDFVVENLEEGVDSGHNEEFDITPVYLEQSGDAVCVGGAF